MDILTLDFETFYDKQYSLSKMTTEEYIRDPRFQVIGVSVKRNDASAQWFSGSAQETLAFLHGFDWERSALLSHNTMFDGAILSWRCGIQPARLLDTMSMSRALHGVNARHSLAAVAERYGVGQKGGYVAAAIGKRRKDFSAAEMAEYGAYCVQDADLTWQIFTRMMAAGFPAAELRLIDLTLRMFTEPVLQLDIPHLEGHLIKTKRDKEVMLVEAGITDRKDIMSNKRFAELLESYGVEPPVKISPTTGKMTFAFAKSDEEFLALQEHESPWVQALVAARLGNKSTLEETRTERFIGIGRRGVLPIPLRYYGAHTGRWAGIEAVNFQNLPSRGPNAKQIKKAVIAPEGHVLINCDSSQIEARVLAWWAEQNDLVYTFEQNNAEIAAGVPKNQYKHDAYKKMAVDIYGVQMDDVDKSQRHVGKTTVLGCGYGMGPPKFQTYLKTGFPPVDIDLDEAARVIDIYRRRNKKIVDLWRDAQDCIKAMQRGDRYPFGRPGVIDVDPARNALILPNGLPIIYDNLRAESGSKGYEYFYTTRNGPTRIYGGKVVENVTQALARIIVGQQMLKIAKKYRVVLTVHDSVVVCVPEHELETARAFVEACMRWVPAWATGLPVNCESGVGRSYGETD